MSHIWLMSFNFPVPALDYFIGLVTGFPTSHSLSGLPSTDFLF